MKKMLTMIVIALLMSGCAITTRPSVVTMEILNKRLSNIEKAIKVKPTVKGWGQETLTVSQREFIEQMMDYLGRKK